MGDPAALTTERERRVQPLLQRLVGTVIDGRYAIDEIIGTGAMGVVFRGRQLGLRRDVAIKVMNPELPHDVTARFIREAESAARLDHPNCITVYEFGTCAADVQYMVMPLLAGRPLTQVLQAESISVRRAVDMGVQILRGLEHAHGRGVIHRDVKPDNIVVLKQADGSDILKLVDFGLAKIVATDKQWIETTMSGLISGTPAYMSPEQALGLPTDARSDLYSAGIVLYRMLAGALPFAAEDPVAQMRKHIAAEVPSLPDSIPRALVRVVERLVRKERDERYADVSEALGELEAVLEGTLILPGDSIASPPAFASLSLPKIDELADPAANSSRFPRVDAVIAAPVPARGVAPSWLRKSWPRLVGAGAVLGILLVAGISIVGRSAEVPTPTADASPAATRIAAASTVPVAEAAGPDLRTDGLEMLAAVNESDPAKVLDYRARHEILALLANNPTAAKLVDAELNTSLDLIQAGQSPTPCRTFDGALVMIEASGSAAFVPALQRTRAPDPVSVAGAGKPPDASCDGLEDRRLAVLATLESGGDAARPRVARRRPAKPDDTTAEAAGNEWGEDPEAFLEAKTAEPTPE